MGYLLLIIIVLVVITILYVPQLDPIRARMMMGLAAVGAAIWAWLGDLPGWLASLFGG